MSDTIVALSSGRLPAGIAVIRVSGPGTRFAVETIFGRIPSPGKATYGTFRRRDGSLLDRGLLLFFSNPSSFSGEDVAEFQVHGSRAVVAALLQELTAFPDVRHAEPGEFTRRAFYNGKLDLTETEALADLIDAETEAQRRFALSNASGAQRDLYSSWRARLVEARALVEAEIDFADEDDVPGSVAAAVWRGIATLREEVSTHIEGYRAAEIIRDGYDVVILGAPNSGKSSLFNALVKRDAAIVTDEAGTTRDLLEVALDLGGVRVRITDTAGIREDAGRVESIGIERALDRARSADLVLILEDMETPVTFEIGSLHAPEVRVGTKADLIQGVSGTHLGGYDLIVSSRTGAGFPELLAELERRAIGSIGKVGDVLPSRLRHVELLRETMLHLADAEEKHELPLELRAESLRLATHALGRIAGSVETEDLLDVIFSQFCIGK